MQFTTRPEFVGMFGAATSAHRIASTISMSILARDGNAFDAWMLLPRDPGRLSLRDGLDPAIHDARAGHPGLPRVCATLSGQ